MSLLLNGCVVRPLGTVQPTGFSVQTLCYSITGSLHADSTWRLFMFRFASFAIICGCHSLCCVSLYWTAVAFQVCQDVDMDSKGWNSNFGEPLNGGVCVCVCVCVCARARACTRIEISTPCNVNDSIRWRVSFCEPVNEDFVCLLFMCAFVSHQNLFHQDMFLTAVP